MTVLDQTNAYCRSRMIEDVHYLVQNCLQFKFVKFDNVMKRWTIKGALDNILKFYFWLNFIYHVKCNC